MRNCQCNGKPNTLCVIVVCPLLALLILATWWNSYVSELPDKMKMTAYLKHLFCNLQHKNVCPPISLHSILDISSVTWYYFNFEISSSQTSKFDLSSNSRFILHKLRQLTVNFMSKSMLLLCKEFCKPLISPWHTFPLPYTNASRSTLNG